MIINYLKDLSKETFYYGIGKAIRRFFSLFTAPIMTRIFEPDDYGVISLITTTMAFAGLVLTLGSNSGIFRHYYEVNDENKKILLFSGIASQMGMILSVILILILVAESISVIIFGTAKYANIIRLGLMQLVLFELFEHLMTLLRYKKQAKRFIVISSIQLFLNLVFLLLFVVYLELKIPGVYIGNICAYSIPLVVLIIMLKDYYTFSFNMEYVKSCLKFSIPLMPGWFINMYLMQSNRFFLQSYYNSQEVGLYSIGEKISNVSAMFVSMFFLAWDPLSMKLIPRKKEHYIYDSVARIFLFIGVIMIFSIAMFSKEVLIILTTEKYYEAYTLPGIIGIGTLTFYFNHFLGQGIIISKKTIYQSFSRILGAIVATVLFLVLIPEYKGVGAAIGLVLGYFVSGVFLYIFSNKLYSIDFKIWRITGSYFLMVISIVIYLIISNQYYNLSITTIVLKMFFVIVFSITQFIFLFEKKERIVFVEKIKELRQIFSEKINRLFHAN